MSTKINNIATNNSTTKFESKFGMLNNAPIKLSGNYKIVVDEYNNFFLDNYNGFRIGLDINNHILPQIANFLNSTAKNLNIQKTKFGGYRNGTKLYWHIPTYLGNDKNELPKYFVLNRVVNDEIKYSSDIKNTNNDILKIIDLESIGLTKIFGELIDNQTHNQYLFYFNWEDEIIKLNGYDIIKQTNTNVNYSTLSNQSNQTALENLNNNILNQYQKNNLIYPLFVNIEFEFSNTTNTAIKFNNYHGYFSNKNLIKKEDYKIIEKITASISKYTNGVLSYKQEYYLDEIQPINYLDIVLNEIIEVPTNTLPQICLRITHINAHDLITINQSDSNIFYQYVVKVSDIKKTISETMNTIAKNILVQTSRNVICDYNKFTSVFRIKLETADIFVDEYFVSGTRNIKFNDNTKYFNQIRNSDLRIFSSSKLSEIIKEQTINYVGVSDLKHGVEKFFYFDNYLIVRLVDYLDGNYFDNNSFFNGNNNKKIISVYVDKVAELTQLTPTRYFGFNSNLYAKKQYDKNKYVENLRELYTTETPSLNKKAFDVAIESFFLSNNFDDVLPYVERITDESTSVSEIVQRETVITKEENNDNQILNMLFNDGSTSYITPNVCNFDYRFYTNNGNINLQMETNDPLRFHWFLIKGITPKYIFDDVNDVRNLRYFTEEPKLTTRLISSSQTLDFCETTFLGVKYQLPFKYEGYSFATYLDSNNNTSNSIKYYMEIDNTNKKIYLVINKYLDFVDLIRGGDITNEPLVDLSFFYCINDSHNTRSEISLSFKTGGLVMCDDEQTVLFNNEPIKDWKVYDEQTKKWYVCLKKSLSVITPNLSELFKKTSETIEFYVYSSIKYLGEDYTFVSLKYTVKNIIDVQDDYFWCEDIGIEFFDTQKFFTNEIVPYHTGIKPEDYNKLLLVDKFQIVASNSNEDNYFGEQTMVSTLLSYSTNRVMNLLNYNNIFSLKKDYFEFSRKNIFDVNGLKTKEEKYFYFPEFTNNIWTFTELFNKFDYATMDYIAPFTKISLFDRNQLWNLIRDISKYELKFKTQTAKQVQNSMNELLVSRLNEYTTLKSLDVINADGIDDKFVNLKISEIDTNTVIWKDVNAIPKITKASRFSGNYSPLLFEINDEIELQNETSTLKNKYGETIFSLYNDNFVDTNINATGFWNEVQGNVVSTLWTSKFETLTFEVDYPNNGLIQNIINGFKVVVPIEEAIINNKSNIDYIKTINQNVDSWIHENYVIWLLDNIWKLDSVTNELNQKIMFDYSDSPTNNIVKLRAHSFYNTVFNKANFNFVRR